MIGARYGSLPIVHDTGGLHDTVTHLNITKNAGNGFVFEHYDCGGLSWAIDQAMAFHRLPASVRRAQITRIMGEATERFGHRASARRYMELYERMLDRPLLQHVDAVAPVDADVQQKAG